MTVYVSVSTHMQRCWIIGVSIHTYTSTLFTVNFTNETPHFLNCVQFSSEIVLREQHGFDFKVSMSLQKRIKGKLSL